MQHLLLRTEIRFEEDVAAARQRARQVAQALGFEPTVQTRIAAAVSEVARNAFNYGKGGEVQFVVDIAPSPPSLIIRVADKGPGIPDVKAVLRETARRGTTGGLQSARRLVDKFEITSSSAGTTVELCKRLHPGSLITKQQLNEINRDLGRWGPQDPFQEMQQQNRELVHALEELTRLNNELAETNRGVVALYAELEEKAEKLRQADEVKSRFLAYISHEFRTPVNSALSLSKLLLGRADGPLTDEQERQAGYIRRAMENLLDMINDLLDLTKVEAGKIEVRIRPFVVADLLSSLRGMFRPLVGAKELNLIVEDTATSLQLNSDEAKVSQILRNLISNAIKFTERGEVRVSARAEADSVIFSVHDTGVGIAPEHQSKVLEEYTQIPNPMQKRVKGTGLGLPLSKKLTELLGGEIGMQSSLGAGSTFWVRIPSYEPQTAKVVIIDDDEASRYVLRKAIEGTESLVIEASDAQTGLAAVRSERPALVVLDLIMPEQDGFSVLEALKADQTTAGIPVMVNTSKILTEQEEQLLSERAVHILHKGSIAAHDLAGLVQGVLAYGRHAHYISPVKRDEGA